MESAPGEGVLAPPDRTIAADMLGALHNVGTAIRDSVSSRNVKCALLGATFIADRPTLL